jgi:putative transposase
VGCEIFALDCRPRAAPEIRDQQFLGTYFYRAVDKFGKTLDFMLSEHRDGAAASAFFTRTIENNGWPEKAVIDKSGANLVGLQNVNWLLLLQGWFWLIEILQVKYLKNMIEQDHRLINQEADPSDEGFKSLHSGSAALDCIEVARNIIRKGQFPMRASPHFSSSPRSQHNCVQR